MHKIVEGLQCEHEVRRVPVTLFTKVVGNGWKRWPATGCDALGLNWNTNIADTRRRVGDKVALQVNMDQSVIYGSKAWIEREMVAILEDFGQGEGHICSLGHGIHQNVPPAHAGYFVEVVHRLSPPYHR